VILLVQSINVMLYEFNKVYIMQQLFGNQPLSFYTWDFLLVSVTCSTLLQDIVVVYAISECSSALQITGSFSAVKKALLSVSSCIQDSPRAETANFGAAGFHGNAMPAQGDLHQWGYGPGNHAADYHPRGYSPNFEEDVVFRLLCQADKVGSLIGKGGSVVRALQNETGASIKIAEGVSDSDERVVVISAREAWGFYCLDLYYFISLESLTVLAYWSLGLGPFFNSNNDIIL
jgi:hypothetical protein